MDTKPEMADSEAEPLGGHHLVHAVTRRLESETAIVIVADDEPTIRKLVREGIHRVAPKVEVIEAEDGGDALAKLAAVRLNRHRDATLLVLDLKMPGKDGWAVIHDLKREYESRGRTQGIPIIVLSSTSGEKGLLFHHSVHGGKSGYVPLVTVAKERCAQAVRYDAVGQAGLVSWVRHFLGVH